MYQELQRRIANAKDLDFGDIFQRSIDLFKKTWSQGLLLTLLSIALVIPLLMIIYVPFLGTLITDPQALERGDLPVSTIIGFVIAFLVVIVVISAISFALNAAFFRMIKQIDYAETSENTSFFMFFKQPHLRKSLTLSLAVMGISIVAALACYLPLIYVLVPLQFFGLFFAFHPQLSVSEVINLSFKLGNKKWLITFGLIIVTSLLAQFVGLLLCFVGVFFTASFVYLPVYLIYKDIIGFDEEPKLIDENTI